MQKIIGEFENFTVSSRGAPLDDGALQTMYDHHAPQLGQKLSDALVTWYRTAVRGDRA